ncbi:hypothetical protein MRX96_050407 [Rhipicephalus microplus]
MKTSSEWEDSPQRPPSSGASSSHRAADKRDTASAIGDGDTDMGCGGEYEAPVAAGFKQPFDRAQLPGYVACGSPCEFTRKDIKVCTLVKRGTAFIDPSLDISEELDINHNLIEVMPCIGNRKTGLFVLSVCSPPSKRDLTHNFGALFREAMAKAASSPLLICGDFNAPHTQSGYGADSPKGKRLAELMDEIGLVLLNEPASHTRIGQAACRDTSPDLSI